MMLRTPPGTARPVESRKRQLVFRLRPTRPAYFFAVPMALPTAIL